MKLRLLLLAVLPLVAASSGSLATAGTAPTPRNGLIAVGAEKGLHVVDPQTGSAALLPGSDEMSEPAWSPDGTLLAVTAWDDDTLGVYTLKPDGSERRLVLQNALSPSWSPDGKSLVAAGAGEAPNSIVIVKADGTEVRELAGSANRESGYVSEPTWSPDGKLIAFIDADDNQIQIRFVSPEGEATRVRPVAAGGGALSWSPDSSTLAFDRFLETGDATRQVVVLLDLATGRETILPGRQDGAAAPVWSPDGRELAFLSLNAGAPPLTQGCGDHFESHLWVMGADGTKSHRLVKGFYYGSLSWARSLEPAPTDRSKPAAERPGRR